MEFQASVTFVLNLTCLIETLPHLFFKNDHIQWLASKTHGNLVFKGSHRLSPRITMSSFPLYSHDTLYLFLWLLLSILF